MTCMDLSTVVYTTGVSRSAFNSSHTWRTVLGPSFQSARMIISSASVGNGTGFESEGGIGLRDAIYEERRRLSISLCATQKVVTTCVNAMARDPSTSWLVPRHFRCQ